MQPAIQTLALPGGRTTAVLLYPRQPNPDCPTLFWLPAMGVRADYYTPWAEALHGLGCNIALGELRGVGRSSVRASRREDFGYAEMLNEDIPATLECVSSAFPGAPLVLGGHSLGGQLSALYLALHPEAARGLFLVASGTPYHRMWPGTQGLKLLFFATVLRMITELRGHLPGHRVGFAGREARRIIREWHHLVLRGRFRLAGVEKDIEEHLALIRQPTLALSFSDDPFCPQEATAHLTGKLAASLTTHHHLHPRDMGADRFGHFHWVRHSPSLAPQFGTWLGGLIAL